MQTTTRQAEPNETQIVTSRCRLARVTLLAAMGLTLFAGTALARNVVSEVAGQVEIGLGEPPQWTPAHIGDEIAARGRIRTGADGRVEVTMDSGTMRVHENSMLRLPPAAGEADRVELDKGHSLFDVLRRGGRRFEVHTPTVVVSVKGTRFGVDTDQEADEVAVYRGMVGVRKAGAADAIETLVREGFLASGGAGLPIELDVAPSGDPWASWSDLHREVRDMREKPARMNDIDRAKASLHRATNVDVLRNAADRKPEIAERLRRHQKERMEEQKPGETGRTNRGEPTMRPDVLPAAPDFDGSNDLDSTKMEMIRMRKQRGPDANLMERLDSRRAEAELRYEEMMDTESMTGGGAFPNGETELDFENLAGLDPNSLMILMSSMNQVEAIHQASGGVMTPGEVLLELENALVSNGMSVLAAQAIVSSLIGN